MSALPSPLYVVKKDQSWFRVDGVATIDDTVTITYYDGTNYRNNLSAGYVGGSVSFMNAGLIANTGFNPDFKSKDDVYNGTAPHNEQFTRTKLQFKSAAVSVQGTTISGNTKVVVPSTKMLRIGMVVSGTGIAANTFIADITDATNIILSIAATASGTVTLTFGEVIVLAQMWLDEFSHYSPFPPQDLGRQVILWPTPTVLNTQMAAAA